MTLRGHFKVTKAQRWPSAVSVLADGRRQPLQNAVQTLSGTVLVSPAVTCTHSTYSTKTISSAQEKTTAQFLVARWTRLFKQHFHCKKAV